MVLVGTCKCMTLGFILTRPYLIPSNWFWNSENKISLAVQIVGWINQNLLYMELIEHENCSDILLSSSQNVYKFKLCFTEMLVYQVIVY